MLIACHGMVLTHTTLMIRTKLANYKFLHLGYIRRPLFAFLGMYPYVFKCNAKRCVCGTHLCTNTTITSSVNGRQFSIINDNDMD